MNELFL